MGSTGTLIHHIFLKQFRVSTREYLARWLSSAILLAFIALLAAQSSAQTRIHNAILVIDTPNNASYNQVSLVSREAIFVDKIVIAPPVCQLALIVIREWKIDTNRWEAKGTIKGTVTVSVWALAEFVSCKLSTGFRHHHLINEVEVFRVNRRKRKNSLKGTNWRQESWLIRQKNFA